LIDIKALIYIPDKIIAGVCFPEFDIENIYPHLTLVISEGWAPVMSNTILTATCGKG